MPVPPVLPALPVLPGNAVTLRPYRPTDAAMIQEAFQDELMPLVTSVPAGDDHAAALAVIRRQREGRQSSAGCSFTITDAHNRAVGQIGLWPHDEPRGLASVGYWIRPAARRRGHAGAALKVLVGWAGTLPALDRLELYAESWNEGSWRAAEGAGFARRCLERDWQVVGGASSDVLRYSLPLG